MADIQDIAQIIGVISAAYPNWNVTEYTNEVYYQTLHDIPADELNVAVLYCISENGRKFAPSVGEIRGAVAEVRGISSNLPSAYQAWEEVQKQILENGGDFGNPEWSNSLVENAVRMIGWRNLRMSEDQIADRARFIQCYEQLVARATRDEMLLPEVRGYLQDHGAKLLDVPDAIKQLTKGMSK